MDKETKGAFAKVDTRFDEVGRRFDTVDGRLDDFDGRLDGMDTHSKAAFAGINGRLEQHEALLVKLTEGQVKHDVAITKLEAVMTRTAGLLNTLAGEVQQLAQAQHRTETSVAQLSQEVRHLGERMDGFAEQVTRGFSKRDEDHAALEARVSALDRRQ